MLGRLDVRAPHVICGHSHRSGPWPGDDLAEWTTRAGGRVHNTGSWVYQPHFLRGDPNRSPYWPGTAILIEDDGAAAAGAPAGIAGVKHVAWQVTPGPTRRSSTASVWCGWVTSS